MVRKLLADQEGKNPPRDPEIPQQSLEGILSGREEPELLLRWSTLAKVRIAFRCCSQYWHGRDLT
jgi:hypothetical protein